VVKIITAFPEIRHVASFNVVLRAPGGGTLRKNWDARITFRVQIAVLEPLLVLKSSAGVFAMTIRV